MKRRAMASSAGSTLGNGGSVSSSRGHLGLSALAICAFAMLALAPPSQAKFVVTGYGTSGTLGGQFVPSANPRGIAVNTSGNGASAGTTYVVDGRGNRIERFSADGSFERAWGQDVSGRDEVQELTLAKRFGGLSNADYGTFTLGFGADTTNPIPVFANEFGVVEHPSPSTIEDALTVLPSIGAGNVTVSGDSAGFKVRFVRALGGTDVEQLVVDETGLSNGQTVSASTAENGAGGSSAGFEICTVATLCKEGSASGTTSNGGQLNNPQGIAVDQSNGHVYVTESGNNRVSEFDADGNFVRAWGWDVVATGGVGDVSTDAFEVCTVLADCKQGLSGANGGEFGTGLVGYPAVESGDIFIPDTSNRRVDEFDSSGNFIAAYGYNVDALGGGGGLEKCTSTASGACQAGTAGALAGQFAEGFSGGIGDIAFDSAGNLYAIDPGNNRVQKFDPTLLASATDFAASLFANYTTRSPEHMISTQEGARLAFSLNNDISGGGEREIIELDPTDTSVKDTSLLGAGLTSVTGLGEDGTAGKLYVATDSGASPRLVLALGNTPPADPGLTLAEITTKTDTTATFSGTVDPGEGLIGSCKFQYSTDQSNWTDVNVPDCASLASGGGPQGVSQDVTKLNPNTHYFVRLAASGAFVPNSTATTATKAFDTDAVPPVITDVGAVEINDTSVRMVGTVDPRNSATNYAFEYGTTPALGSSTTALAIGDGTTPLVLSQVVSSLSPDVTYYFQLVATNLTGTTASTVHTFHTRATPLPNPENRRWEMVSPPDKNYTGADNRAFYEPTAANVSPDGNAVGFCSSALFGEPPGRMTSFCAPYIAKRGADGWQTTHPFPEYCYIDPVSGIQGYKFTVFPSRDYSHFVFSKGESAGCPIPPLSPNAPLRPATEGGVVRNIYFQDSTTEPASYDLLTPRLSLGKSGLDGRVVGGSDDYSHVVYKINSNQTDPPDSPAPGQFSKLYSWEQEGQGDCVQPDGCLSLVSKDTNNVPFATSSDIPAYNGAGTGVPVNNAVSSDGNRIFFQNPTPLGDPIGLAGPCEEAGCELYMREGASVTFDVSASECTLGPATCGTPKTKADTFVSATPSADKAFFVSCATLTNASSAAGGCVGSHEGVVGSKGSKLYRWDRSAAPGQRLVDLTVDHEPGDDTQPDARGVLGTSDDGDIVYFTANGQIVSGQSTAKGEKLYRWQWNGGSPTVDYLGPYQGFKDGEGLDFGFYGEHRNVTPDGKYLLVYTKLALDPAADSDSDADAYRWDASDGWLCLTCQAPGAPSAGDIDRETADLPPGVLDPSIATFSAKSELSEDGQRFFFGTPDALVPQDVNGQVSCPVVSEYFNSTPIRSCFDVYEWHDGTISLISSGTSDAPARLIGSTPSGNDVFFYTSQRLVGWDLDSNVDIYNSRVGGGFPEPPAQPPVCEGEACRGAGTSAPSATGAGTAVFQGPGNPTPKHQTAPKHHKKRQQKKRHHKRRQRAAGHNRRAGR